MGKPATLKVDVVSDSRQARQDLDSFSSKVAGFTAGITASVASFTLDKITDFAVTAGQSLTDGIDKAASLSAALGTLRYNYGEAATALESFAKNAAKGLGLSEVAAVNAANRFSVYAKALNLSGKDAGYFSAELTTLAANLGAFSDLGTDEAINAIGSAFRGERDPLEKFGVLLNDANVKAAYFRRTGEEVNGTLTTQQNILGTLQVLQEKGIEIGDAFGRESEQLGNKQQVLNAQFDNVKTKIGEILLPAFGGLTDFLSGTVIPVVDDLVGAFQRGGLSAVFEELGKKWGEAWPSLERRLTEIYEKVTQWIGEHVPSWTGWLDGIQTAWDGLLEWLGREVPSLGEKVSTWLRENLPKVGPWVIAFAEWIGKAVNGDPETGEPGIIARLSKMLDSLAAWIEDHGEEIARYGMAIGGAISAGFSVLGAYLSIQVARIFLQDLPRQILGLIPSLRSIAQELAVQFGNAFSEKLSELGPVVGRTLKAIFAIGLNQLIPGLGSLWLGTTNDNFGTVAAQQLSGPIASATGQSVTLNVNVEAGFGTNGNDVGAAIVAEIQDYVARTGSFPIFGLN